MIDGFRLDVTAEELARHLDERIRHHRERAQECAAKAKCVEPVDAPPDEDDDEAQLAMCWPGYAYELERRGARHSNREIFLTFARDHIVAHEIYRLTEHDLKTLEWLPLEASMLAV